MLTEVTTYLFRLCVVIGLGKNAASFMSHTSTANCFPWIARRERKQPRKARTGNPRLQSKQKKKKKRRKEQEQDKTKTELCAPNQGGGVRKKEEIEKKKKNVNGSKLTRGRERERNKAPGAMLGART